MTVLQRSRLRWYGRVLRKDNSDWVKKYIDFMVEGVGPRSRPTKQNMEGSSRGGNGY